METEDEEKRRIDELREELYSRSSNPSAHPRRKLRERAFDVRESWEREPAEEGEDDSMAKKKANKNLLNVLLLASAGFFLAALGITAYFFLADTNTISARNIDITVDGPTSIDGGEALSLQINVRNNNDVAMQLADLILEYPEGTRSATNLNTELPRYRESLGTIEPGDSVRKTVRAVLFGEANSEQVIQATVEYRVEGSNAIFVKEESFPILISSSPLSISVEALNETTSGQEIELVVEVVSNSETVLKDVLLKGEYPFGFSFSEASPEAAFASDVWELGDIPPGGKRVVRVRGTLTGQDDEERVFRFESGIRSEQDEKKLAAAFITAEHSMVVKRPFLAADLAFNGTRGGSYVASPGEAVRVDVTLTNTLPDRIFDAEARLRLIGAGYDRSSVSVSGGFFRSGDNTVIWDRNSSDTLAEIPAGETVTLSFSLKPLSGAPLAALRNPEITLEVDVSGRRVSDSGAPEAIQSTLSQSIQVATEARLLTRGLHFTGAFDNSGPIPPVAERETTYTVVWSVTNGPNRLDNTTVTASLPPYVRWLGTTRPSSEDISFNPVGGKVTWRLGSIEAGAGSGAAPREVSFQVGLTPSISQVGEQPVLIGEQTLSGTDRFTGTTVRTTRGAITTSLTSDPQFPSGGGAVQSGE